ncbi:MAG TPA: hypothetical protein VMH27_20210 [Puia sp.]|nr:hypothetical protein [Puia sp.]
MDPRVTSKKASVILLAGILLLQTIPCMVHGQSMNDNFVQDDYAHRINLYDVNGRPIGIDGVETKGSPFFTPKWKQGWFRLADGRTFSVVTLKLDLEKQVVHYLRADGTDIEVDRGQIRELAMLDTINGVVMAFRFLNGLQPIDNQSQTNFYLLLDSGKVSFLESMRKELKQDKEEFSGETHREYNLYSDFYVLSAGKMTRIKKDAKFFLELTNDKRGQMEDYLQKNKVSFRSIDDIGRFISYYNGLP